MSTSFELYTEAVTKRGDKIVVLCLTKKDHGYQTDLQEFTLYAHMEWKHGKKKYAWKICPLLKLQQIQYFWMNMCT